MPNTEAQSDTGISKSRKQRALWRVSGMILIAFLAYWLIHRARQPRYQGKTVEEWFSEVTTASSGSDYIDRDPAVIGLRHLGTNAVWFLWHEQARKESPLLVSLEKRLDRLTGKPTNYLEISRADTAWRILFQFGPEIEVLIPDALKLMKNGKPEEASRAALLLGRTKRQPEVIVPAILQSLAKTNRNSGQRVSHIVGLKEFGPQAKAALPYLRQHLAKIHRANSYEGYWLAMAILTIDGPGPELGFFTQGLVLGDYRRSYSSLVPLERLGTNARPAAVELHKFMLTLTNAEDSARVLELIRKLDPEGQYDRP